MQVPNVPDLSALLRARSTLAETRGALDQAARELGSGLRTDLVEASGGDPAQLYRLDGALARLAAYSVASDQAAGRAAATQFALQRAEDAGGRLAPDLLGAVEIGDRQSAVAHAREARAAFEDAVAALNTRYAGRSLFAGAEVDGPALADAETMLADIAGRVAGTGNGTDALAAIHRYFHDPSGGFVVDGYLGARADAPAAELAPGARVDFAVRADDVAIRDMLQSLATVVMGVESGLAGDATAQATLFRAGATGLIAAGDDLTALRADVGQAEQRIADLAASNVAETTSLELARADLLAVDPFEAASRFQALEQQLQSVYTVTARLASLSLVNFLR
ncbi:MAG: flagellin [Pseudomonadota bacterium]